MTYSLTRPVGFLGQASTTSQAGEINGVGLLLLDLCDAAARGHEFMQPGFKFKRLRYESMMNDFRPREGEDAEETTARVAQRYRQMSGEDIQTLIAGTIGVIAEAVTRARAVAQLPVASDSERASNHALQASVIDPARRMWDMLSQMLRNMEARRPSGTSGLGALPVAAIVAIAVVGAILGVAAIAAGTYLADSFFRVQVASREAERICNRRGGCTAEQEAAIRRQLQLGPFDDAFKEFAREAGEGLGTALTVVGIGGAVVVTGAVWYYALGGREWIRKVAQRAAERRQMRRLPG